MPEFCFFPLCFGAKIAGIGVAIGIVPSIGARLRVEATGELELKYQRDVVVEGKFAGHALRASGVNYNLNKEISGFKPQIMCDRTQRARLVASLHTRRGPTLRPSIHTVHTSVRTSVSTAARPSARRPFDGAGEPELSLEVDALVQLAIVPHLKVGLFGGLDDALLAEAP